MAEIYDALLTVQAELNAPKGQYNSFGKFSYRSCEDILVAVKPLLKREGLSLTLTDEPVMIGDWHYIKATAMLRKGDELVICNAFAREPSEKKGMDESQISGCASSYARKYALNGLFLIDDSKDADAQEPCKKEEPKYDKRKAKANEQADAKNRCWRAVKKFAAEVDKDPKEIFEGIRERNGFDDSAGFWTMVAVEFETA